MAEPTSSARDDVLGRLRPWRPGRLALRLLGLPFAQLVRVQRVEFFVPDFSRVSVPADEFGGAPRVPIEFRLAMPQVVERFAADFAAAGVDPAEARRRLGTIRTAGMSRPRRLRVSPPGALRLAPP